MSYEKFCQSMRLSALAFAAFAGTGTALASTCVQPDDWIPGFCDLPIATGHRCVLAADNWVARGACVSETDGCAALGGCFGTVPIGHWYPYVDDGVQKRCQCGCFAEETVFATINGAITGTEIITQSASGKAQLLSLDSLSSASHSERMINGITFGPEKEKVFVITTAGGRVVTLSSQHPVLIVNEAADVSAVKAASKVTVGEFVLTEDGVADRVSAIDRKHYSQRMVNFNVASVDAQHHFVPANGIVLGDNAWQQRLASVDARILLRMDLLKDLNKHEGNSK